MVKCLLTHYFEVKLVQDEHGRYQVQYSNIYGDGESEWITDFGMASYMFDLKISEIQGQ